MSASREEIQRAIELLENDRQKLVLEADTCRRLRAEVNQWLEDSKKLRRTLNRALDCVADLLEETIKLREGLSDMLDEPDDADWWKS